jgi:hypothetical protein
MLVQLEMGPNFKQTVRELGSMGENLLASCHEGLRKAVKVAAGRVVSDYLSGQALRRRTGTLSRAVDGWMAGPLEGVVGVHKNSGTDKYKWLLGDEQMTITPKNAQFLTIPVGENLTGAGVARFISPRQVPDGFFFKSKAGRLMFGRKQGKRGKIRPMFVLVKNVFIQGSGALYDGVMNSLDDMAGEIDKAVDRGLNNA